MGKDCFLKIPAKSGLSFVYFRPFYIPISITEIEKTFDGVLGILTRGRRIVGADKTTELWWPPNLFKNYYWGRAVESRYVDLSKAYFIGGIPRIRMPGNENVILSKMKRSNGAKDRRSLKKRPKSYSHVSGLKRVVQ